MGATHLRIDILGKKFGYLTVVRELPKLCKGQTALWECICVCGNATSKTSGILRRSKKISCGCIGNGHKNTISYNRFYMSWLGIKGRCLNPKNKDYAMYGGRGITMCEEWKNDFTCFEKWCNRHYVIGKTIDREDNSRGYSPDNCRFATPKEQCNNRSSNHYIEYDGVKKTISQWAEHIGIKKITLQKRIKCGWSFENALNPIINVHRNDKKNKRISATS